MRVYYDFELLRQLSLFILIPILVILTIASVSLFIYKEKYKDDPKKQLKPPVVSAFICLFISTVLFSVSIAFSITFIEGLRFHDIVDQYRLMFYLYHLLPVVPFIFVIYFFRKLWISAKAKPIEELEEIETEETEIEMLDLDEEIEIL